MHLEGAAPPDLIRRIAERNGLAAPDCIGSGEGRTFGDFSRFVRAWIATSSILQRERDFHDVTVAYAADVAAQGCVYLEAAFSPAEPARRGTPWEEVFEGYCSGAAAAREACGVEVRLVPEITRDFPLESAELVARWAVRYRDRGVVGLGLGGNEAAFPCELFAGPFALAREGGLHAAPHAGETDGAHSVQAAIEILHAKRVRHGIRAAEDGDVLARIARDGVVCDVAPTSNVRLGIAPEGEHPLPLLLAAGVRCSVSTDDPALLGIDVTHECELAARLGHTRKAMFEHAVDGAFCDEGLRARLRLLGESFAWERQTSELVSQNRT